MFIVTEIRPRWWVIHGSWNHRILGPIGRVADPPLTRHIRLAITGTATVDGNVGIFTCHDFGGRNDCQLGHAIIRIAVSFLEVRFLKGPKTASFAFLTSS